MTILEHSENAVIARIGNRQSRLGRARPVVCWGAVLRETKQADGSDDWVFVRSLALHDQGGRVRFGGGDTGTPKTILRLRAVD